MSPPQDPNGDPTCPIKPKGGGRFRFAILICLISPFSCTLRWTTIKEAWKRKTQLPNRKMHGIDEERRKEGGRREWKWGRKCLTRGFVTIWADLFQRRAASKRAIASTIGHTVGDHIVCRGWLSFCYVAMAITPTSNFLYLRKKCKTIVRQHQNVQWQDDSCGVRTHADRSTRTWVWRLRPLGQTVLSTHAGI